MIPRHHMTETGRAAIIAAGKVHQARLAELRAKRVTGNVVAIADVRNLLARRAALHLDRRFFISGFGSLL